MLTRSAGVSIGAGLGRSTAAYHGVSSGSPGHISHSSLGVVYGVHLVSSKVKPCCVLEASIVADLD